MMKPKSGKPKKITPEVLAELEPRYEALRSTREALKAPTFSAKRPQLSGWPASPIHPELRNVSVERALQLGSDAMYERDDLRRRIAWLEPIVERDLEILNAQSAPDRENPGGRPSTLPEGWEAVLKQMRKDHPAWQMKRLDWEASLVFRVPPETVSKARQAAARNQKKER